MNVNILRDMKVPEISVEAGTILLKQGEKGSKVHVLAEGEVQVVADGQQIARIDAPGTVLGEISALLATTNVADVKTTKESKFFLIEDFMSFLKDHPDACVSVAQVLAVRLVNMNNHLVHIKTQMTNVQESLENYMPVFPETESALAAVRSRGEEGGE
jgi:CRP-like cAMP-binding protein